MKRLEKLKATTTDVSGRITVQPLEIFSFWTMPGHGSEWAGFGLARFAPLLPAFTPRYPHPALGGYCVLRRT
jgi:hypothetical protein